MKENLTRKTKIFWAWQNERNKRVFHLTPAGRQAFQDWLISDIEAEKVKDPGLTRLYFMGFSNPQERVRVLEAHVANLHRTLAAGTHLATGRRG